ncbi:MAG: preprotein translocase subunit SecE [Candidatus Levybacteria bacterium]|nr:preprotein translocase subunit SecE [Candidatus Levybacteria bacterium]MBI3070457.1 preprotein translocase subunit SecE [Candidatus Levybacteria bacterium]MBI3093076.1 preprotein translocase subunit SecE [Candidatus Levybacteria bacterium]
MVSPATFLKETREELKKVTWPTQQEVVRLTTIVIIVSLIVGLLIGAMDFLFTKTMETIIK